MKFFVVLAVLVAAAAAFPQFQPPDLQQYASSADAQATVLQNENNNIGVGDYQAR